MMILVINKIENGKAVTTSTFYPNPADKTTYKDECQKHLQTLPADAWDSATLYDCNNSNDCNNSKNIFICKNSGFKSSYKYAIYL